MEDSILKTIKSMIGLEVDDASFDVDVTNYINGALFTLRQLRIGPRESLRVAGEGAKWEDLGLSPHVLDGVVMYIAFRVRLAFDPPKTSYEIEALNGQKTELEQRLSYQREEELWDAQHPSTI